MLLVLVPVVAAKREVVEVGVYEGIVAEGV